MATAPGNEMVGATLADAKPPFLRRVRIRGYKSIAFCDVTLEPLTILVGRNASGKSNFLDALAFLGDLFKVGLNEAVKRHGGADALPCHLRDDRVVSLEVECEYALANDTNCFQAAFHIDIEFPKRRPARIQHEQLRIEQDKWWLEYTNDDGDIICSASDDSPQHRFWKVKDRPFVDSYHDTPVPEFVELIDSFTAYNFRPDVIRQLQKPSQGWFLEHAGGNLASVIEATREMDPQAVTRIGRYLSVITRVDLLGVAKYGDFETVRFQVARNGNGGPLEFDASSMSDGTLRVLAALVAAFQVVPPHGSPSLVAIEEPETSLHPDAMRALVDALDEATLRTQILLTTHGAEMLDNPTIRPDNIRVVQMIDGQTVIAPVDEASVEIVRRKLSTLGGLERDNLLEPNLNDLDRQQQLGQAREESPA